MAAVSKTNIQRTPLINGQVASARNITKFDLIKTLMSKLFTCSLTKCAQKNAFRPLDSHQ
jgi:hypothetical protein